MKQVNAQQTKGRVVHCRVEAFDVYIGRGRGSVWGNPFSHKNGTKARYVVGSRDEAISAYRAWLWERIRVEGQPLIEHLAALHGKTLGCWCKPQACHGDVLVEAAAWAAAKLESDAADPHTADGSDPQGLWDVREFQVAFTDAFARALGGSR